MKTFVALLLLALCLTIATDVQAQVPGTTGPSSRVLSLDAVTFDNPMTRTERLLVCGGAEMQGTPIAGNASGGGTSGSITIAGIPATAKVVEATLWWTVLTNSDEASQTGKSITFAGSPVTGTQVGFSGGATPCFPQANTVAWKADVTSLVSSPGTGIYAVSGFPGGNQILGANFTEGTTLKIVWQDDGVPLKWDVRYEGLAVSTSPGVTLTQTLTGFTANASGPVSATWYPVIGNGQVAPETLFFAGSASALDFSNDALLKGQTSEFAAQTCSYSDIGLTECYWDDRAPDVSAAIGNGSTLATVSYQVTADCHDFVAMQLVVSAEPGLADTICSVGSTYVDIQCPPGGTYKNHGAYMQCVAHAAEVFLASVAVPGARVVCEDIQSCIVNPKARSNVGKP